MLKEFLIPLNDMPHKQQRLSLTQPTALFGIKIRLKITILTVFQKQIQVLPTLKVIIQLDNVGRIKLSEILDLILYLFR